MNLQEKFFEYIRQDLSKSYSGWQRKPAQQWYNCYSARGSVILCVKKPNKDGSFHVFVSIDSKDIFQDIEVTANPLRPTPKGANKWEVTLRSSPAQTRLEIIDRGRKTNAKGWGNWPVGLKIVDESQFELARLVVVRHLKGLSNIVRQ